MLFITHDMSIVAQFCDDVVIMKQGRIVERGTTLEVFNNSKEAYTKNLLSAIPKVFERQEWLLQKNQLNSVMLGDNKGDE